MTSYTARRDPRDESRVQVGVARNGVWTTYFNLTGRPEAVDLRGEIGELQDRIRCLEVAINLLEREQESERGRVARLADVAYQEALAAGSTSTDAMAASLAAVDRDRVKRGVPVR